MDAMEVTKIEGLDRKDLGITGDCELFVAHVKISDLDKRANEMFETISNTSWIQKLDVITQQAFKATSQKTITKLIQNITERNSSDTITVEFGEYMISDTAQSVLVEKFDHKRIPLAEILKARLSGNEGFDFHTECKEQTLVYGEAKYSGSDNPYQNAMSQIASFIENQKDDAELIVLMHFASETALQNHNNGIKSYAAAFSINAKNPEVIIKHALQSEHLKKLTVHHAIYIIGVELNAA